MYDSAEPTHEWGPIQVFCKQMEQRSESEDEQQTYNQQPQLRRQKGYIHPQTQGQSEDEGYDQESGGDSEDYDDQSAIPMIDLFAMFGGILMICACLTGIVCMGLGAISVFIITKKYDNGDLKIGKSNEK